MSKEYFKWENSKFSVGVGPMDEEHKQIVASMNTLYSLYTRGGSYEQLLQVVESLTAITLKHFKDEESFFDSLPDYAPFAAVHKQIHADLLVKFMSHISEFKSKKALSEGFFNFLKGWLQAHICGIDMKYSEAAKRKTA